jgi:hypothetical protein
VTREAFVACRRNGGSGWRREGKRVQVRLDAEEEVEKQRSAWRGTVCGRRRFAVFKKSTMIPPRRVEERKGKEMTGEERERGKGVGDEGRKFVTVFGLISLF